METKEQAEAVQPLNRFKQLGLHRMQPTTGVFPDVHFNISLHGQAHLSIFCRSGPVSGRWFERVVPMYTAMDFLNNLYYTFMEQGPEQYLKELELFFGWEWTEGGKLPNESVPELSLDDLGL